MSYNEQRYVIVNRAKNRSFSSGEILTRDMSYDEAKEELGNLLNSFDISDDDIHIIRGCESFAVFIADAINGYKCVLYEIVELHPSK